MLGFADIPLLALGLSWKYIKIKKTGSILPFLLIVTNTTLILFNDKYKDVHKYSVHSFSIRVAMSTMHLSL